VQWSCHRPELSTITQIYVLGQDGNLWFEQAPWGTVPPARQQVDALVADFFPISSTQAVILGTDGNLWLAQGPWGTVPPKRQQIDSNVASFFFYEPAAGQSLEQIYVLGTDGNLWLEQGPWGTVPPKREQIDANVLAFQPVSGDNEAYILGQDRNLWLAQAPWGTVPPKREQVDGNVAAFYGLGDQNVVVESTGGDLWYEQAPWGTVRPKRQLIDQNVAVGTPTPPPPPPSQFAPTMSDNGTVATWESGEITVPGGLPLSGYFTIVMDNKGDFTFTCHAHDAGFDGIHSTLAVVIMTPDAAAAFTFGHLGYEQGTIDQPFGQPNRNDDPAPSSGFNQEIVNVWPQIPHAQMSYIFGGSDEIGQDLGQLCDQLINQLLQAAGQAVVGAVESLV